MKRRSHTDDGGRFAHMAAHRILRFVDVAVDRRQRAVVADRAAQYIRNLILLKMIDDTVFDLLAFQKLRDRTIIPDAVDGVQMIVMPIRDILLGVNILTQCGVKEGSFQIVGRQCIAGQHRIHVPSVDQLAESISCIVVEGEGRSHDPDNIAMFFLVFQQAVKLIIITGKSRLSGFSLTKSKGLMPLFRIQKSVRMNIDAF